MAARCVPVPHLSRCLRDLDTLAIEMPSISSDCTILCPPQLSPALFLLSPEFILPCRALVLCRCHSSVSWQCPGAGRAVPLLSLCCPRSLAGCAGQDRREPCLLSSRRHSLGRECGVAAKRSPALPMFLMLFCFSGGARSGSSSIYERG